MFSKILSKIPKPKKPLWIALILAFTLILGISIGYLTNHVFSENAKFEAYADKIFQKEVSGNTLTLHYSLAHPEKEGILRPSPTLGTAVTDMDEVYSLCEEYEEKLKSFSYSKLSKENQLTLDTMLLYFHTQRSLGDNYLLEEFLSPSLGIQAQLPVLLAEYAFYEEQDIKDYLSLLTAIKPYFESILEFEEEKSGAGYFMSDQTLDRILKQCGSFIQDPKSNYMLEIFSEKISDYGGFSKEEQEALNQKHKELVLSQVIPAYETLMKGLEKLRGTGKDSQGLAHFNGGRQYYLYLLQSQVGSYVPVEKMEQRISQQLMDDSRQISLMLTEQPSLLSKVMGSVDLPSMEPDQILGALQEKMAEDFPSLSQPEYEVRYVHESMEEFLSPAFYLTPPIDTGSPNVIYINQYGNRSNLELFTTLAHEGFPGHLYQTVFFGNQKPEEIRSLLNTNGYVEGWATYIESYAYRYAASFLDDPAAIDVTALAWLNRSVNLSIYSLLDIGIHYHGWNATKTASFLAAFGIQDSSVVNEIFQYIVETPANYLNYYWGYLNFLDLKSVCQQRQGESFDLKEFHEKILKLGPVPFPVLEKYIKGDAIESEKQEALQQAALLFLFRIFLSGITSEKFLQLYKSRGQRLCLACVQIL